MESNSNEFIINIELNDFRYFPEDIIEGIINLKPNDSLDNKFISNDILLDFSLIEKISYYFEEYDYTYETISHFNESKSYLIHEETKNYDYLKGYLINYGLKIPFQFQIPKINGNNNLFPTFIFRQNNFQCYITHQLNIKIKDKSNKCTIDIFIRKPKLFDGNDSIKIFKDEIIKKYLLLNKGKLSYYIETNKSCSYFNSLPIEIHLDKTDLKDIKIKSIIINITKTISFKDSNFSYNEILISKEIILSNDLNNNQIKESINLTKGEFSEVTQSIFKNEIYGKIDNDIIKKIKKYNYSPPVDNIFFNCIYFLKIIINFEDNLMKNRIIEIPIDYYDGESNKHKKEKKIFFNIENLKEIINNLNSTNLLNDDTEGFTLLTKDDFIDLIDGKKNTK